jgi:hypothetical protein
MENPSRAATAAARGAPEEHGTSQEVFQPPPR